jgi:hypothetical protein
MAGSAYDARGLMTKLGEIAEAPVRRPSMAEFSDPIAYIKHLYQQYAGEYGR